MSRLWALVSAYGATLVTLLHGLVSATVLTRLLSVEEYGVWTQYRIVGGLAVTAVSFNLGHGYLRFGSGLDPLARRLLMSRIISAQLLLCTVGLLIAWPFADILAMAAFDRTDAWLLLAVYAWAVLSLVQIQLANTLVIQLRAALAYASTTAYRVASLAALLVLIIWPTLAAAVAASLGVLAGTVAVLAWLLRGELPLPSLDFRPLRDILAFCLPLFPVQLAVWVCASSDRFFIKYFEGLESVAHYSLVYTFASLIPVLFSAVSNIFLSAVSRWYDAGELDRVSRAFGHTVRAYWFVGVGALTGVFTGAAVITQLVAGERYLFADVAEVALQVGAGGFVYGLYQIFSRLFDLARRPWAISATWVIAMVLNLGLNWLLIPLMGLTGAALATTLSYSAAFGIALLARPREIRLDVPLWAMAAQAVCAVLIALGAVALAPQGLLAGLGVAIGAGVLVLLCGLAVRVVDLRSLRDEVLGR